MGRVYRSLVRRADFARVRSRGAKRNAAHLSCFVTGGRDACRVGITVSAAVGGAVERNRLRRRLKALLDGYPLGAPPWRDIVIIARPGAAELTFAALRAELERCFG